MTSKQQDLEAFDEDSSSHESENREVRVGDMGKVITGGTPSTKHEDNYGGDYPFIRVSDFGNSPFIEDTGKKLTQNGLEEVKNKEIPEGAVMVSCIGTGLGKTAFATENCVTNQQINSIVPGKNFDNWYVYYKLTANRDLLQKYAGGSAQPILSKSRFSDVKLEVQPYQRQKKIGRILSTIDQKIRTNKRTSEILEEMSQTLFKRQFIEFEDYVRTLEYDEDFEQKVPNTWNKSSLEDIANFLNGKAWQQFEAENEENNLPVIKIKELRNGISDDSDRVAESDCPKRYIIEDGRVIFSWSASLVLNLWTEGPAFLNQHLFKVTSEEYPRWFFYEWINYHIHQFRNIAEAKKTTMGHIKRSDLKQAKVLVPPKDELENMSEKFVPILDTIVQKRIENRHLGELRDTLLPKLISGDIMVSEISLDDLEVDDEV